MRIFLTGATGFIGSAIVPELLGAGHQVSGLVRSDANAAALEKQGGTPVRGSIEDLDVLARAAESADGVIHTAFVHDFANFAKSCATDQAAIKTIGDVLVGSNRPLAITTGTPIAPGRASTERDEVSRDNPISALRAPAEDLAMELAGRGVRSMIMRMPRAVHGTSDQGWKGGLISPLMELVRAKKLAVYVGDGQTRWPAAHRLDTARLYRLAIEKGQAGSRWHSIGDEGVTMRAIAEAIGKRLGVPVASKSPTEAGEFLGFFAPLAMTDQASSSAYTREQLGLQPTGPDLISDLLANA
jgi:nucleoside-diphosphate-sugar epimerase